MEGTHAIPVLYSQEEIAERLEELAEEIAQAIPVARMGELVIVSLMRGSFMFTADLVRALWRIGVQPQLDFMAFASYQGAQRADTVQLTATVKADVTDKTILIIDDILESGRTLDAAAQTLRAAGARTLLSAVLLEKTGKLEVPVSVDFVGFRVPDRFVVGYGLDYDNHYRELPYIGYLEMH
jgi:hypoxanthine phosphoribosyltransferase